MGKADAGARAAVGDDLAAVLPDGPWHKKAHLVKLNFVVVSLVLFSSANGYDGSLMNGLQALNQWNDHFDRPAGAFLGFLNAIYWIGAGCMYPVAAIIANKYGRKLPIWIGYAFLCLGAGLQAGANNEGAFAAARFFVGNASACFSTSVPLLISEIAYPSHRGIATALYNCGWYVGGLIAAFLTFGTRNMDSSWAWRVPSLLQILVPFLALPGFLIAPQSPRWLISMDRNEEAQQLLTKWHGGDDQNSQLVNYEMIEITTTLQQEKSANSSASYAEMFKTPGNRKRLFISVSLGIFAQWVGNGVVSYYLALVLETVGITSVTDITLISGFLQLWNLIFCVGAAFSVDRLGRRALFLASAVVMGVSYVLVTGLSGSFAANQTPAVGIAVIPFLFIFFAGYDIALTPLLYSYPCEIWPYRLRSRGLTVTNITTVLAICFNTFVNPIALERIAWRYYIVFVVVLIIYGITVYVWFPETKGYSLEQMAVVFDGNVAEVPYPAEIAERSASMVSHGGEKEGVVRVEKV
ncbi:general substrate transporter [Aureobasidium pullulans]|uniref:General substrate transporter n=1 Tax=Aureobasidium pullulans TaxID=5580 RepID=A0A4S8SWG0_AURPU|nr:general substrate transporter [Aureobasidium pullulans]THY16701.1 general substrate transporter [Aureobasidium pullulans]